MDFGSGIISLLRHDRHHGSVPVQAERSIQDKLRSSMLKPDERVRVLFLCTGNSCRSQMAEGWARQLQSGVIDAYSAGVETHGLNPLAVRVMAEVGVDISHHWSKRVDEVANIDFDFVVTVCGHANENCPMFPGKAKVVHVGFDDPPKLAEDAQSEAEALDCYRTVRDQIRRFIETLPETLQK
jgi:arsenate reductase